MNNSDDLKTIQKNTEYGHGLRTLNYFDEANDFTRNYFCYILSSGYFASYLSYKGIANIKEISFEKKINDKGGFKEKDKLISLSELLRRIPELNEIIEEYIGEPSLAFNVGFATVKNHKSNFQRAQGHFNKTGQMALHVPDPNPKTTTYISIYPKSR